MCSISALDNLIALTVPFHSVHLSQKNGVGKNGPAGPILDEKLVRPDHSWLTKNVPAGPILVTKSGPAWPKMVQCHYLGTDASTMYTVVFSGFSCACSCLLAYNQLAGMNWHIAR